MKILNPRFSDISDLVDTIAKARQFEEEIGRYVTAEGNARLSRDGKVVVFSVSNIADIDLFKSQVRVLLPGGKFVDNVITGENFKFPGVTFRVVLEGGETPKVAKAIPPVSTPAMDVEPDFDDADLFPEDESFTEIETGHVQSIRIEIIPAKIRIYVEE